MKKQEKIKKIVKENYARIARQNSGCCATTTPCCTGTDLAQEVGKKIGYSRKELRSVPEGANLGLGCGNPLALSSLKEGETVLDLGSGAGFDCFLAANKVGPKGKVIGIDMTPEMIEKARGNARKGGYQNVEFKLGEIEKLPVPDNSVDLIISNCVINLSPDKTKVFKEVFRVLKPGARMMISDIVLLKELPDSLKKSVQAYVGCLAGAVKKGKYSKTMKSAGFQKVKIVEETVFPLENVISDPLAQAVVENLKIPREEVKNLTDSIMSIKVSGVKP